MVSLILHAGFDAYTSAVVQRGVAGEFLHGDMRDRAQTTLGDEAKHLTTKSSTRQRRGLSVLRHR
jgi:hypothetical protein